MKIDELPHEIIDVIEEVQPELLDHNPLVLKFNPLVLKFDLKFDLERSFIQYYLILQSADDWFLVSKNRFKLLSENERACITISATKH